MTKIDDINANLERIGNLIEKAINPEDVQIEIPPPQCPNCKRINPTTLFDECQLQGPFAEYLLAATCLHCKKVFYGLPIVWVTVRNKDEARKLMTEHLERLGLNGNSE